MISTFVSLAIAATVAQAAQDTTSYIVLNHGRPAGEMSVMRSADTVIVHYRHVDRNRGNRNVARYRLSASGTVTAGEVRTVGLYDGVVAEEPSERFELAGDSIRWNVRGGTGATHRDSGYYRLRASAWDNALLVRELSRRPGRAARLIPGGVARLEFAGDTVVATSRGSERVRLAMIHSGSSRTPQSVWVDEGGELFASGIGWFITVREGAEQALPALRAVELAFRDSAGEALARELAPEPASAIAIVNGNVFDAERGVMMPGTTVLVRGDRIVEVGPAGSVTVPRDAEVVDAAGKSVIPGLWEMHSHMQHTTQTQAGIMQLARGITTSRDLAADTDVAVSYRDRAAAGRILGPRMILGGFMEGPGAWAGPSEVLVHDEAGAREWVARYDSLGYRQVKLYNLTHPDLVPVIAEEAHRRGMRLSGHIPRGMSTQAAVLLGFDEVNHAAFLLSTFYPDSLWTPEMRAYSLVANIVAPNVNVDDSDFTSMIELFRQRGTVIDGTFSLWMQDTSSGSAANGGAEAARRANANWLRLIKRLHDAGVTLVPGTDAQGSSSYVNELELYERAGIPTPEVLRMATVVSARVMGDDGDYGSIAPGKVADIVIVDANPAQRIGDLRNVQQVMLAGRLYESKTLLRALRTAQ